MTTVVGLHLARFARLSRTRRLRQRLAALPLENILAALDEMQELADWFHQFRAEADAPITAGIKRPAGKIAWP